MKPAAVVLFPVSDLGRAKAFFGRLLGVEPMADSPYYVGYQVGEQQIGLDPSGVGRGMRGATPFWDIEDIAAEVAGLVEAGATVLEAPHDVGGGLLVAILADPDGNTIGLRQAK